MAEDIRVSVVIPMYYAQDYVDDLLDQLCAQPLKDIEIICVIDGSPDATLDKVKAHAQKDARIQWVYQENAGAGAARNVGLARARGTYLAFLDADDVYDPLFLSTMYETAEKHDADLVVCQFVHVDCKTGRSVVDEGFRPDRVPTHTVFAPEDLEDPFSDIFVIPHNKLYRTRMVERAGLRFSETMVSNDNFFVLCSIASAQRIVAIPNSLVEVRRYANPHSISSNRALHIDDMFQNFQDLYHWLVEHSLYEQYKSFFVKTWADTFHYNASYDRNERYIECAVRTLACEEPWRSMSNKELQRSLRLDTGWIEVKRLFVSRHRNPAVRELELTRLRNEESAILEVIRRLNSEYHKNLSEKPRVAGGVVYHLKNHGLRRSAAQIANRIGK